MADLLLSYYREHEIVYIARGVIPANLNNFIAVTGM